MDGEREPADLTPAEAARARRRDRDAEAGARRGMSTGLAKQFKQVLDTQARRAREAEHPGPGSNRGAGPGPETPGPRQPKTRKGRSSGP